MLQRIRRRKVKDEMRREIFSNDVCDMYNAIEKEPEEFFDEDELEGIDDDMKWDRAYAQVDNWLDDEVANLNVNVKGQIILVAKLVNWQGASSAYMLAKTKNIGKSMAEAMSSFGGDNTFNIYVEDGKMWMSQLGHDNPVNPSIIEFRELTVDFDDLPDDKPETLLKNSKSLAPYVCDVYGWEVA